MQNNKLSVLHIISGGDVGGAMVHVINLLKDLKERLHITLVTFMEGEFTRRAKKEKIDLRVFRQKTRFDLSPIDKLLHLLEEGDYQIIHCHGARANFMGYVLKKRLGKNSPYRFVTTVHSDYLLDFKGHFLKDKVFTGLNIFALKHFDYYIGVSKCFYQMLIDRGFPEEKLFFAYNGLDFNKELPIGKKEDFFERYGIPFEESCIYIGILARMDRVKGHEYFIRAGAEALKSNDKLRFILAGDGNDRKDLEALVESLGMKEQTYFIGFIKDKYSFLHAIDINVLSSVSESFPFSLLEGARLSKPTISSDVGGISDLIIHEQTGLLFKNRNSMALAKGMLELSGDRQKAQRLGEELYRFAKENFSSEAMARDHIEIYNQILEKNRSE